MPSFQNWTILPGTYTPPCVPDGTQACPFTSLGEPTTEGTHWYAVGGLVLELYSDGNDVLLRVSDGSDTAQAIVAPPGVVSRGDNAQYDQATIQAIASDVTAISFWCPRFNEVAITTEQYFIDRLANYQTLNRAQANYNSSADWTGSGASRFSHVCLPASAAAGTFDQHVYHACGNGTGLHWMNNTWSRWINNRPDAVIELWVK